MIIFNRFRTTLTLTLAGTLILGTHYISATFDENISSVNTRVDSVELYTNKIPQLMVKDDDILSMELPQEALVKLDDFLFIGDSFTAIMQGTIKRNNDNVYVHAKSGSRPSHWLDKVASMPSNDNVKGIVLLIGVNGASTDSNKQDVKTLIDLLANKYPNKTIYVQEVFPTGRNFRTANPTSFNKKIKVLNDIIRTHCETVDNAVFINTQEGFVDSEGYLLHTNDGLHIAESYNQKFYDNIFNAVNNERTKTKE